MTKETRHRPLPMAYIQEHLAICSESPSGLKWITSRRGGRWQPGPTSSRLNSMGYFEVDLQGDAYRAHRIVYALHHGTDPGALQIDHKDTDRTNNHPDNLRLATHAQNQLNKKTQSNNTSGIPGVGWDDWSKSWKARVGRKGSPIVTKRFKDITEAAAWVAAKRLELFGEFAPENRNV